MFYIQENERIVLVDADLKKLQTTVAFMSQYANLPILETEREIVEFNNGFAFKDEVEDELKAEEAARVAQLFLTGADVERGIYQAKGMDFDDILAYVTQLQPEGLDIKALKIELKANNFYRGNPYVEAIGQLLGFTSEQLDQFFEDGNYEHLLDVPSKNV